MILIECFDDSEDHGMIFTKEDKERLWKKWA